MKWGSSSARSCAARMIRNAGLSTQRPTTVGYYSGLRYHRREELRIWLKHWFQYHQASTRMSKGEQVRYLVTCNIQFDSGLFINTQLQLGVGESPLGPSEPF